MEIIEHKRYYVYRGICINKNVNGIVKYGGKFLVNIAIDDVEIEREDSQGRFKNLGIVSELMEAAEMYYQAFKSLEGAKVTVVKYDQMNLFEM